MPFVTRFGYGTDVKTKKEHGSPLTDEEQKDLPFAAMFMKAWGVVFDEASGPVRQKHFVDSTSVVSQRDLGIDITEVFRGRNSCSQSR